MRSSGLILSAFVLPLLPAAAAAARPATRSAVIHDWTRSVVITPEGGFRMGNPSAPVKLVEYGSLACPHCQHFEETGYKPLVQQYVRTGKVSYEFRNLLINGPDISISLLARCSGPSKFFSMSHYVYADQQQWQKKFEDMSDADKAGLEKMTQPQQIARFAEIGGFAEIASRFGVAPPRARTCLADPKALQKLLDMTKSAMNAGINHTPTFLIDGKVSDASTWEQLEPQLKAALASHS